jgi:hypothetical protein
MALANDTLIAGDLLAKGVFTASEEEEHGDLGGVRPRTPNKDRLEKRWARRSGMGRWKAGEASGRAAAGRRTECRELKSELRSAKDKSIASDKANRRGGGQIDEMFQTSGGQGDVVLILQVALDGERLRLTRICTRGRFATGGKQWYQAVCGKFDETNASCDGLQMRGW